MLEMLLYSPTNTSTEGEFVLKQTTSIQMESWIVPEGVKSICVVVVGHGSLGGGGLSWRNNIPVIPGEKLSIELSVSNLVYAGSSRIRRDNEDLCVANAGSWWTSTNSWVGGGSGGKTTSSINDGGGSGGTGIIWGNRMATCGGAGGYMGNGGAIAQDANSSTAGVINSGSGSGARTPTTPPPTNYVGGHVGLYGIGTTGASATPGSVSVHGVTGSPAPVICGGGSNNVTTVFNAGIRIIWGEGYSFPSNAIVGESYLIPVMTSDTAPVGYNATANTSGGRPYQAFTRDNMLNHAWYSGASSSSGIVDDWLMIELPIPAVARRYAITAGDSGWSVIDYQLQGSNDGFVFTDLHTVTGRPASDSVIIKEYNIPNTTAYKYYRVHITKTSTQSRSTIRLLNLFGTAR